MKPSNFLLNLLWASGWLVLLNACAPAPVTPDPTLMAQIVQATLQQQLTQDAQAATLTATAQWPTPTHTPTLTPTPTETPLPSATPSAAPTDTPTEVPPTSTPRPLPPTPAPSATASPFPYRCEVYVTNAAAPGAIVFVGTNWPPGATIKLYDTSGLSAYVMTTSLADATGAFQIVTAHPPETRYTRKFRVATDGCAKDLVFP